MNSQFQAYKQVNINTMNRGKIVIMLFTGAITFLNKAKLHMESRNYFEKGRFINKALDVINELNVSLDLERGQDIAKNLRKIYTFATRYVNEASIKNDPQMIDSVINILNTLKSAFEEIVNNPEHQEAQVINKQQTAQNVIRRYV